MLLETVVPLTRIRRDVWQLQQRLEHFNTTMIVKVVDEFIRNRCIPFLGERLVVDQQPPASRHYQN
jgi:hypothetical protein